MKKIIKDYFTIKDFNNDTNKKKNILLLLATLYLLLALESEYWNYRWPDIFYTALDYAVVGTAGFVAYHLTKQKRWRWLWIYVVIIIFFNPFLPMPVLLDKYYDGTNNNIADIWRLTSYLTAMVMIYSIFKIKLKDKSEL